MQLFIECARPLHLFILRARARPRQAPVDRSASLLFRTSSYRDVHFKSLKMAPQIVVLLKKNPGNQAVKVQPNTKVIQRKVSVMIACSKCGCVYPNINDLHQHMRQMHFEYIKVTLLKQAKKLYFLYLFF